MVTVSAVADVSSDPSDAGRSRVVAQSEADGQLRIQDWLLPPLQVQSCTAVPLAVPAPLTSRHSPDPTPTIVPSGLTRHCWPVPPLQLKIRTRVPAEVPGTSRHLVP